ncbi:MAG: sulfatase-like hydrolase/transferase [Acidobacteriota bacterium]|nr:sulfatase-like hydrolase/transferase [Acidobacteriota bacterium]
MKSGNGRDVSRREGRNVLLVTLDTTRADRLGCYGYGGAETPNIDRLASGGVLFRNAYAPTPLTLPSHASIMTGLNPFRHGVHNNGTYVLTPDQTTLAEILKAKGYTTAAFTASFSVDSRFGLDQGFDVYDDDLEGGALFKQVHAERRAEEVFQVFSTWLDNQAAEPFFAWIHFFDPHLPYDPPPEYREKFPGRPYDGEIAYMDKFVGEAIDRLQAGNRLQNTLVVVAGDHGEAFGEKVEQGHGIFLYEMVVRVPLIFHSFDSLPEGKFVEAPAGLIDIMPTVLDLLKIETPGELCGQSLVPVINGKKVKPADLYLETFYPRENWGWSELVGLVSGGWKYIQAPRPELYDLNSDPDEERNLLDAQGPRARELKARLEKMLAASTGAGTGKRTMSPAEQERLRSLGYVQFSGGPADSYPDPKDRLQDLKRFQQATILEAEGRYEEAERIYRELIGESPDVADNYINLALAQGHQKKYGDAAETLRQGLAAVPDSEILLVRLGHTYLVMQKLPDALEAMQKALALNASNFDALVVSALAHESRGEIVDALGFLQKALDIEPGNESLRLSYARNLGRSGRTDEAIRAFTALARDYPEDGTYFYNLGVAYGIKKDFGRAIENLETALRLSPSPRIHLSLAAAYLAAGLEDKAVRALEAFLADPGDEDPATIRGVREELARLKTG